MSVRVERVSAEVRGVIGEVLSRDEIKDPRVRGAGLITVTHVRISGDLQHGTAFFTVHDLDAAALERVRQGLNHAAGYFRQAVSRRLRMKVAPAIKFEVDQVFEKAAHVEKLEARIRSRRIVFAAVLQIMRAHDLSEAEAFALIRQTAMRHRTTVEQLSAEIVTVGGMPNRTSRSA